MTCIYDTRSVQWSNDLKNLYSVKGSNCGNDYDKIDGFIGGGLRRFMSLYKVEILVEWMVNDVLRKEVKWRDGGGAIQEGLPRRREKNFWSTHADPQLSGCSKTEKTKEVFRHLKGSRPIQRTNIESCVFVVVFLTTYVIRNCWWLDYLVCVNLNLSRVKILCSTYYKELFSTNL